MSPELGEGDAVVGFVACGHDHMPRGWGFCRMPRGHEGVCAPTLEFVNAKERAKLVHKIYQQRRQLKGLNKTIRLYRLLWLEAAGVRDHHKQRADGLAVKLMQAKGDPATTPPQSCWWCRVRAKGERWWRGGEGQ